MLLGMKTVNVIGAFRSVFCHSLTSFFTGFNKADATITLSIRLVSQSQASFMISAYLFSSFVERTRAKPVVLPMSNATVFVGENVTLICRAYSDAKPHFQWLRWFPLPSNSSSNDTDSKKFSYEVINQNQQDSVKYQSSGNNKDEFHGVPLSLVNVTKKDEGKYTCIVGNALGYSVKHAYIIVQEKLGKIVLMLK